MTATHVDHDWPTSVQGLPEFVDSLLARFGNGTSDGGAGGAGAGQPADRITAMDESSDGDGLAIRRARELQAALYEAGFGWLSGPREYGGQELAPSLEADFDLSLLERGLPSRASLFVGLHIVAPAVLGHGSPAMREWLLPGLFSGSLLGCQLFSEPDAGSDLAAVTTRGVRDGDDWVISGQKVWTSWAHVADVGEALVRTDANAAKHAGLTMFAIDMSSPGVLVRPLRQATGDSAFNEVFLDEVRVPDANRIGAEGSGWTVANTSLTSERGSMASGEGPLSQTVRQRFRELIERELRDDPVATQQVARTIASIVAALSAFDRESADWEAGLVKAAPSIQKMLMVRAVDGVARSAEAVLGSRSHIDFGEPDTFSWSEFVLGTPGLHLAGGTDEIQRTLIAQLGLGFPRPARVPNRNASTTDLPSESTDR